MESALKYGDLIEEVTCDAKTAENYGFDPVILTHRQESALEEFEKNDWLDNFDIGQIFKSKTFNLENGNYLNIYPTVRKPDMADQCLLTCALANNNPDNKTTTRPPSEKRRKIDSFHGVILTLEELLKAVNAACMTKAKFMSIMTNYELCVQMENNRKILFTISKTYSGYLPKRKVDIRLYMKSTRDGWIKTRYGITQMDTVN